MSLIWINWFEFVVLLDWLHDMNRFDDNWDRLFMFL